MAGPRRGAILARESFSREILFTNEESPDYVYRQEDSWPPTPGDPAEREAGVVVALDVRTGQHRPIYGMGRHNHENDVAIPGYHRPVVFSGDDTFTSGPLTDPSNTANKLAPSQSQLYSYIAPSTDSLLADGGDLWAFVSDTPGVKNYYDVIPGSGTGGINVPQVRGLATNRIDFNSISRNDARPLFAPGVQCISSPTSLTARYNIIWDNGTSPAFRDQVNAAGCDHKLSDIGPLPASYGMMNVNTDPLFMDELAGDLHLMKPVNAMLFANPTASEIEGPAARDIEDELRTVRTEMGADHVAR